MVPFRKTGAIRISYLLIRTTPCSIIVTEACLEKSNEIKAVPVLIDKIDISGKDCHRRYHVNAERILGKKWEKSTTLANTTLPGKNYYPPLADKSLNILNIPFPCYAWGHRFCPPTHG